MITQHLHNQMNILLDQYVAEEKFSGVVLIRDQDSNYQYTGGLADRSWNIPTRINTRFRIASISKMFTALAILRLIEQKICSFEDPINMYLDLQNTTLDPKITIYHLLTMTAGIADWFDESGDWEAKWAEFCTLHPIYLLRKNEDYLPLFQHLPPEAPPGKTHKYNGASYILLGLIIQIASGLDYYEYIRRYIFNPGHMNDSDFIGIDTPSPNVAKGYIRSKSEDGLQNEWIENIYSITPIGAADGGAVSTAPDLVRFSQAIRADIFLDRTYTLKFLTPQVSSHPDPIRGYRWYYGFGNNFITDDEGRIIRFGHTGEEDGVSCRFYHYPGFTMDVIILANQSWCAGKLGWEIHDLLTG